MTKDLFVTDKEKSPSYDSLEVNSENEWENSSIDGLEVWLIVPQLIQ